MLIRNTCDELGLQPNLAALVAELGEYGKRMEEKKKKAETCQTGKSLQSLGPRSGHRRRLCE
jgi:hypothetical protein